MKTDKASATGVVMGKFRLPRSPEEWVFGLILIAAAAVGLLHELFPEKFPEWPLLITVFLGIYFILLTLRGLPDHIRRNGEDISLLRGELDRQTENISALKAQAVELLKEELDKTNQVLEAAGIASLDFRFYATGDEFYPALRAAVEQKARRRVHTTYIRRFPWEKYEKPESAVDYFDYSVAWAKDPRHQFRRIMIENNYQLTEWIIRYLLTQTSRRPTIMR